MSFNSNQKSYNKDVMKTGREANQYLRQNLGLINQYTTNYADRTDFWTNKLNNRQLNLLSDKYLAENANMLRGSAAFGSNSATNRQIENNAYDQQNYLANVANENIKVGNQLQQNELASLMNAAKTYENPVQMGSQAAANVDAANNAIWGAVGKGISTVGNVASIFNPAVGGVISGLGSGVSAIADQRTSGLTTDQQNFMTDMFSNAATNVREGKPIFSTTNRSKSTLSNQNKNR